ASFVGTQFLAFSTSLPELAASFAAIRINAPELAISNVLGSNLFNMGFILFMDDVALTGAPLWTAISGIHMLTAAIAILMTSVIVIALMNRPRNRPSRFWTVEAVILIGLYLLSSVLVFKLG
ncbi:MAG: sodium:calcium antiporter, partial [Chloroflexi bacterium]|nr:sodium:calcium antiporter [Chloroflexota bacterium]